MTATATNINRAHELEAIAGGRKPAKDASKSDDDLARLFITQHPELRYVAAWSRWLAFNGQVWVEDRTLDVFNKTREMLREVAAKVKGKQALDLKSSPTVAAVERLARSDPRAAATTDQWDRDDDILNTPAGIVDLRTGEIRPHDPTAYCTKLTAASPVPDALWSDHCPTWCRVLREVTGDDPELMDFVQRMAGYCATGRINEHAMFFFWGTGANGKGTVLNMLVKILNDYATVAPMEVFTESHTDRHPTELAMMRVVRLVVSQETEEGRRWAESRIKAITGGDPISARFMRQDFFTFTPRFKLVIAGNHKPKLRNVDEAMRRRLNLVPFTVTIPPARRDKHLADKLEAESAGIMTWIVQGAVEYFRLGLTPPRAVTAATEDYFGAEDIFTQWLDDRTERGVQHWEPSGLLFGSWKAYAEAANHRPGDQRTFVNRMSAAGFDPGNSRAKNGRHWNGLRLIQSPGQAPAEWWDK